MIHLVWLVPAALAIVAALLPQPPGPWLDRAMHFFGIGSLGARGSLTLLFGLIALFGAGADLLLSRHTGIATTWRILDAAAIGAGAALVVLALISRIAGRDQTRID